MLAAATVLALPSFLITLAFTFLYGTAGAVNALIVRITGDASGPLNFLNTPFGVIAAEISETDVLAQTMDQ